MCSAQTLIAAGFAPVMTKFLPLCFTAADLSSAKPLFALNCDTGMLLSIAYNFLR